MLRRATFFLYGLTFSTSLASLFVSTPFAEMIHSRAAVVMDASTGRILYSKNSNRRLPPASTTKLMTAVITLEKTDLSKTITISRNASQAQPLRAGLKKGDRLTVEQLLYAALLRSANDASIALAEGVAGSETRFVQLMNQKAISMGALNTRFINSNGLPGRRQYTTAEDLSKIMRYALSHLKLKEIIGTPVVEFSTEKGQTLLLKNTDELLWSEEGLIGGKTGYTVSAGHCFVCATERGKEVIIVTLLGSPSRKRLWQDTEVLIQKGFQMLTDGKGAGG